MKITVSSIKIHPKLLLILPLLASIIIIILIYGPSLNFEGLYSDDDRLISHAQALPGSNGFMLAWNQGFFMQDSLYWRPFGLWTFQLGNLAAEPFRMAVQHAIQIFTCCLLALSMHGLATRLSASSSIDRPFSPSTPWIATLLAASPFLLESTLWFAARFDLMLAVLCCFLTSYAFDFLQSEDKRELPLTLTYCILFTTLALFTKESAPFPIAMALACAAAASRRAFFSKRMLLLLTPIFVVALLWTIPLTQALQVDRAASLPKIFDWEIGLLAAGGYGSFFAIPWIAHATGHVIGLNGIGPLYFFGGIILMALLATAFFFYKTHRTFMAKITSLWFFCILFMSCVSALDPKRSIMTEFFMSERYALSIIPLILLTWSTALGALQTQCPRHQSALRMGVVFSTILSTAFCATMSLNYSTKKMYWGSLGPVESSLSANYYGTILWNEKEYKKGIDIILARIQQLDLSSSRWADAQLYWNQELIANGVDMLARAKQTQQAIAIAERWQQKKQAKEPILLTMATALAMDGQCDKASRARAEVDEVKKNIINSPNDHEKRVERFYRYNFVFEKVCGKKTLSN